MRKIQFPKLTPAQLKLALDWVNERMRPIDDVLKELEEPRVLEYLDSIKAPHLYPVVKKYAKEAVLGIGGSNGMDTFKPNSTNRDIDFFWFIKDPKLKPEESSQLSAVLGRCLTPEVSAQRMRCTIEGVELQIEDQWRTFDVFKVGTVYKNIAWAIPNTCRHCMTPFYDGRFVKYGESAFIHESCLAQMPAEPTPVAPTT